MTVFKVFIVHLRRPGKNDFRTDPIYESGSFGCTGCHSRNLMNIKHADELAGARLAFAQGGKGGFRLVFLTPPITIRLWRDHCEARWDPKGMPFKYESAPVLVSNTAFSDFPLVADYVKTVNRSTIEGQFSSRFRSSVKPLPPTIAKQIVSVYESSRERCDPSSIAKRYWQALPNTMALPLTTTKFPSDRAEIYRALVKKLRTALNPGKSGCKKPVAKAKKKVCQR